MSAPTDGPFVTMAAFCQQLLQEKDDTITAVRIIDRLTLSPDAVGKLRNGGEGFPVHLWAVVILQPGTMRGSHTVELRPTAPTGQQPEPFSMPALFPDGEHAIQITVHMTITVHHEGTTVFDVYLDDQFLTRMPLRVTFTPPPSTSGRE